MHLLKNTGVPCHQTDVFQQSYKANLFFPSDILFPNRQN